MTRLLLRSAKFARAAQLPTMNQKRRSPHA